MKILQTGGKLLFIKSKEKEKKVYFWAEFDSDEVVAAKLAWKIYGPTIGANSYEDCQKLLGRLPFVQLHGNLRVIGGRRMFAPKEPISLREVGVTVKKYATKGWSINEDELKKVINLPVNYLKEVPPVSYASTELKKTVETEAVSVVRKYYEDKGWKVISVESQNLGYDLLCIKEKEELHIEVKGTSSTHEQFILTRKEHKQMKTDPKFLLCLVSDVLTTQKLSVFSGQEVMSLFNIDPLQYQVWHK